MFDINVVNVSLKLSRKSGNNSRQFRRVESRRKALEDP